MIRWIAVRRVKRLDALIEIERRDLTDAIEREDVGDQHLIEAGLTLLIRRRMWWRRRYLR